MLRYLFVVAQDFFCTMQPDVTASCMLFILQKQLIHLAAIQYIVTRVHWLNYLDGYYT